MIAYNYLPKYAVLAMTVNAGVNNYGFYQSGPLSHLLETNKTYGHRLRNYTVTAMSLFVKYLTSSPVITAHSLRLLCTIDNPGMP